jgi:hypothetical protein
MRQEPSWKVWEADFGKELGFFSFFFFFFAVLRFELRASG